MKEFQFKKLQKKRPLWKDLLFFTGTVFGVWCGTHVFLNFDAFAEIAKFRFTDLKTSVIMDIEVQNMENQKETVQKIYKEKVNPLKKIEKKKMTFRHKKIKPKNESKKMFEKMNIYPSDNRLYIPRIGKNVPLVDVPSHKNWKELENVIQKGLQNGVVVHPVSHSPGNFGNFFLTGHSSYYKWDKGRFKDVFALLHEVKEGDIVEVYWEGKKYEYKMRTKKVVPPTAVEVLNQPKDESTITLMTCTPVGTNKNRLILVGELKK